MPKVRAWHREPGRGWGATDPLEKGGDRSVRHPTRPAALQVPKGWVQLHEGRGAAARELLPQCPRRLAGEALPLCLAPRQGAVTWPLLPTGAETAEPRPPDEPPGPGVSAAVTWQRPLGTTRPEEETERPECRPGSRGGGGRRDNQRGTTKRRVCRSADLLESNTFTKCDFETSNY